MADNRFATIDALRGVAAIGVMMFHTGPATAPMRGGYLAVDLFFAMSGFVIALSYERRLRQGMALREFLTGRAVRLWPMLFVGALVAIVLHGGHAGMLFLLPDPRSPGLLYPANPPYWSLLLEALAYLCFALFACRLKSAMLVTLIAASGVGLVVSGFVVDDRLYEWGAFWHTLPAGLARLCFSFTAGVLIFRIRSARGQTVSHDRRAWLVLAAMVGTMLLVPDDDRLLGLASIMIVIPVIVWFGTGWQIPAPRFAEQLGALSYPLYCIHLPVLAAVVAPAPLRLVAWPLLIAASLLLDRYWDRPMRRRLSALLSRERAQTRIGIST